MTLRRTFAIATINLASLTAYGHPGPAPSSDSRPAVLAFAGPTTDSPPARPRPVVAPIVVQRVPEATLRDLTQMVAVRDWMRRQIVSQARNIPEDRYQRLVRPKLVRQLRAIGLGAQDVKHVLDDVDYSRGLQGHHRVK